MLLIAGSRREQLVLALANYIHGPVSFPPLLLFDVLTWALLCAESRVLQYHHVYLRCITCP